jgi:hypothetical protein
MSATDVTAFVIEAMRKIASRVIGLPTVASATPNAPS